MYILQLVLYKYNQNKLHFKKHQGNKICIIFLYVYLIDTDKIIKKKLCSLVWRQSDNDYIHICDQLCLIW